MTPPGESLAIAAVMSVLTDASPPAGVTETYFQQIMPPAPPGLGVSEQEMHEWLEALPVSIAAMLVPLVGLAAQAIADLADERGDTPESVLADVAARVRYDAEDDDSA